MTDGKTYDVPNHDAAFVKVSTFEIGLDLNEQGIARRSIDCSILHISDIEEPQPA